MRFTVKAKLGVAFGALVLIFGATGGLAYLKLDGLATVARDINVRGGRMEEAAQIESISLREIRAEKNAVVSTDDAEIAKFVKEAHQLRDEAVAKRDEVHAVATEAGKTLLNVLAGAMEKRAKVEDEILRLATLNSAPHGVAFWKGEGKASLKAVNAT
jgi:methyl-accepting chemotaxis protein